MVKIAIVTIPVQGVHHQLGQLLLVIELEIVVPYCSSEKDRVILVSTVFLVPVFGIVGIDYGFSVTRQQWSSVSSVMYRISVFSSHCYGGNHSRPILDESGDCTLSAQQLLRLMTACRSAAQFVFDYKNAVCHSRCC